MRHNSSCLILRYLLFLALLWLQLFHGDVQFFNIKCLLLVHRLWAQAFLLLHRAILLVNHVEQVHLEGVLNHLDDLPPLLAQLLVLLHLIHQLVPGILQSHEALK